MKEKIENKHKLDLRKRIVKYEERRLCLESSSEVQLIHYNMKYKKISVIKWFLRNSGESKIDFQFIEANLSK